MAFEFIHKTSRSNLIHQTFVVEVSIVFAASLLSPAEREYRARCAFYLPTSECIECSSFHPTAPLPQPATTPQRIPYLVYNIQHISYTYYLYIYILNIVRTQTAAPVVNESERISSCDCTLSALSVLRGSPNLSKRNYSPKHVLSGIMCNLCGA